MTIARKDGCARLSQDADTAVDAVVVLRSKSDERATKKADIEKDCRYCIDRRRGSARPTAES